MKMNKQIQITLKDLSKQLSIEEIEEVLYWKITEFHNMRESSITTCKLCSEFYKLFNTINEYENKENS